MKPSQPAKSSPLHKLFVKQQPKVAASDKKGKFLKTFADDDYKKIAQLIQTWLQEDEQNKPGSGPN